MGPDDDLDPDVFPDPLQPSPQRPFPGDPGDEGDDE